MVSSASEGTASHAEGQGLQRDSLPTQGQGESHVLAYGFSTLAAQKSQGPLSTCLSGSQPHSWAGEYGPARTSIMAMGSPTPWKRKKGPGGCQGSSTPGSCGIPSAFYTTGNTKIDFIFQIRKFPPRKLSSLSLHT